MPRYMDYDFCQDCPNRMPACSRKCETFAERYILNIILGGAYEKAHKEFSALNSVEVMSINRRKRGYYSGRSTKYALGQR